MRGAWKLIIAGFAAAAVITLGAEEKPPTLTDVQRLTFVNLAQRMELAQLRADAAKVEFEKAATELRTLMASVQKPGYDFDLQAAIAGKEPYAAKKPAEK